MPQFKTWCDVLETEISSTEAIQLYESEQEVTGMDLPTWLEFQAYGISGEDNTDVDWERMARELRSNAWTRGFWNERSR